MTDKQIEEMIKHILTEYERNGPSEYLSQIVKEYVKAPEDNFFGQLVISECGVIKHKPQTNHKGEILLKD